MAFDKQVQKVVAAAMAGNVKAVKKYLDGGGDPDVVDFFGFSILQRAVGASQVPVVELLLDRGATLTEKAIERAKEKDHPEMLAFLASRGVSVKHVPFEELPQDEKDTRLFKAVRGAGFDALAGIVETMVSQGASLGARQGGRTPLMVLAHECSLFTAAAETMIRLGADVGATDDEGRTALHLAAAQGAGVELARALLDAGLNVDVRDAAGRTPLHAAAESTYHSSQLLRGSVARPSPTGHEAPMGPPPTSLRSLRSLRAVR